MGRLLEEAKRLREDEAGGHGNRWDVFFEEDEPIFKVVSFVLENGTQLEEIHDERVDGAHIMYLPADEDGVCGVCAVVAPIQSGRQKDRNEKPSYELISGYPVFIRYCELTGTIDKIERYPNGLEARIWADFEETPFRFAFFDELFAISAAGYEKKRRYRFGITALAYHMESTEGETIVLDDPEEIRRYRAHEMWVEKYGLYDATKDEESAFALFDTSEDEKKMEPVVIDISQTYSLVSHERYADDAYYSGEVVEVQENFTSFFGLDVWRIDVKVAAESEGNVTIPFYLTERQFKDSWRPKKGEFVRGRAWIQGAVEELNGQ